MMFQVRTVAISKFIHIQLWVLLIFGNKFYDNLIAKRRVWPCLYCLCRISWRFYREKAGVPSSLEEFIDTLAGLGADLTESSFRNQRLDPQPNHWRRWVKTKQPRLIHAFILSSFVKWLLNKICMHVSWKTFLQNGVTVLFFTVLNKCGLTNFRYIFILHWIFACWIVTVNKFSILDSILLWSRPILITV